MLRYTGLVLCLRCDFCVDCDERLVLMSVTAQ